MSACARLMALGCVLLLAGCASASLTSPHVIGGAVATMWATSPSTPPAADPDLQMPAHESWCYGTMSDPQCYTCPQDLPPSRLIGVDPPSRFPVTMRAYNEALAQAR